jgi:hypothetical protein
VKVEHRLASAWPDVDHDPVVLDTGDLRRLGDELEHPFRLVGRKSADVTKSVHMTLGQHEEVGVGLRVDVADRDEALACVDVVALADEVAEETVGVRQRGSPPR